MEVKIQQWGNSAAIRLPANVLKQMSLSSGDVLTLDASTEVITLKPAKVKLHYRLADLMAKCDLSAPEPTELAEWNTMQPIGREV
ncbi:AbrB/MazE/SpoVT family DNA-binding domain-containing protein [Pseudomonas syringae pv. theae]|uniref:AbrB/MazE/SpoVT family DNA-binding domain-containing protein n=1 Tax=Pseudomonas syringae TaxID=317 RepID=UPI001EEE8341|nr:AbrB/MazE/SpoVT family DNA-binding domain-containing protein [Pseudomonas syringae]MBL3828437.1 AbrB/MazE/SpoVT family DNA-binding domain-containing protein [Pseudomonas syringae pv. theae]MBL3833805.1 AbrB/MazE/SpoVT family DNA-binding domain-containing protein [Pseudomonas syringae pv. theae]MBL3866208.1 AbrB/MazE/SpoVT family DNA-binding domain-containing protein [Pseudomonas syringae pv. theae]GKQ47524.1 AbrB/MazE/SpoVT family DNA-binding domain-containing protein [Pseudomonas syringae p